MTADDPAHPDESVPLVCHRCACMLTPGAGQFFVVRIDAVCDPTAPQIDAAELTDDIAGEWERLLDQVRTMSERELMDQVHRRLTILLCAACFASWIENPTR